MNIPTEIKEEIKAMQELNDINSGADLVNAYGKGLVTPQAYKQHVKRLVSRARPRKSYNALYIACTVLFFVFAASCTREDSMGRLHFKRPNIHLFKHHAK